MAIEAVKIPSNIQVEEQIIGPLSLRQIIIMLISGGISYAIWTMLSRSIPNMSIILHVLSWTPLMLGAAFSFVHVNGVSLLTLLLLMIEGLEKPRIRSFGPRSGISINIKTQSKSAESTTAAPNTQAADLATLSTILDTAPRQEDIEAEAKNATTPVQDITPVAEAEPVEPAEAMAVDELTPTEPTTELHLELDENMYNEPTNLNPMRDLTPPTI